MKKSALFISLVITVVIAANSCVKKTPYVPVTPSPTPVYSLVWEENFDGPSLDAASWSYEEQAWPYNAELEYYTARTENSYFEDGKLVIQALKENYGGREYTSARIKTENKKTFTYGKIEARIKMPYGKGIWPAFWTLGDNISSVSWPMCGEIDIVEMVGGAGKDNVVHGALHWNDGGHRSTEGQYTLASGILADDYHIYAVEWTASYIKWFFDGIEFKSYNITGTALSEEFHHPHHILLNLAVGGTWPGSPDTTTVFPQRMYIDWVKIWQRI